MRIAAMLLMLCIGAMLAACEKTDFEKKSEADAAARRAYNLRQESGSE